MLAAIELATLGLAIGDAEPGKRHRHIAQGRGRLGAPEAGAGHTARPIAQRPAGERVDRPVAVADLEMQVREAREAREPDEAEGRSGGDAIARRDGNAATTEVAILGLPALAVVDEDAVPALAASDGSTTALFDPLVALAVADGPHGAGGRRPHRHAGGHRGEIGYRQIDPVVAVVGKRAARRIAQAGPRIMVEMVDDPAIAPGVAGERQGELEGGGRTCEEGGGEQTEQKLPGCGRQRVPRPATLS